MRIPANVAADAIAQLVPFPVRACSSSIVSSRADIATAAGVAELFASSGLRTRITAEGGVEVECDQADVSIDPAVSEYGGPVAQAGRSVQRAFSPGAPQQGAGPGQQQYAQVAQTVKTVDAKWVPRTLLDKLSGVLGVRIVFDDVNDRPVLLAGPADAVGHAESYIKSLNRCPVQLKFEGSIIQSADSTVRDVDAGLRIGNAEAHFGTAGVSSSTGLNFPWLTAFLDASKEKSRYRVNATHSAQLLVGEKLELRDGSQIPVQAATSVTDRETRVDVVYKNAGFNFDLTLLAVDGRDALLALFQDFSAVGVVTDLGPTFSARSVRGVYRVRLDEPQLLAVSGSDSVSQSNRRGILSKRDFSNARKDGSFLVFQLRRTACAETELATASTAGAAELE